MNTNRTIVLYELRGGGWEHTLEMRRRVYSIEGISPTVLSSNQDADFLGGFDKAIKIEVKNEQNNTNPCRGGRRT